MDLFDGDEEMIDEMNRRTRRRVQLFGVLPRVRPDLTPAR